MIIRPSADVRLKYNEVINQSKETQQPIYLTRNGQGEAVIIDLSAYEKEKQELKAQQLVLESIASRLSGAKSLTVEESKDLVRAMREAK